MDCENSISYSGLKEIGSKDFLVLNEIAKKLIQKVSFRGRLIIN